MKKRVSLEVQLAGLEALSTAELRDRYFALCGKRPPQRCSHATLVELVGFRLQLQLIRRLEYKMSQAAIAADAIVELLTTNSECTGRVVFTRTGRGARAGRLPISKIGE